MQSKRDYAASLGLAKAGARGKFSNAAKEAIAAAEAKGMKFSDATGATVKSVAAKPTGNPTEKSAGGQTDQKTESGFTPYLTSDEYRFPEKEYRAISFNGGKKVEWSLREYCNTCRVSLVNHMCDSPTILGDVTVKIERR